MTIRGDGYRLREEPFRRTCLPEKTALMKTEPAQRGAGMTLTMFRAVDHCAILGDCGTVMANFSFLERDRNRP
ncbi:hypothetical protein ACF1BQ_028775 [Bradyrhizobium sp. RDT10]